MGRADRGSPARPEGVVGAMDEGGDLLELFGSDLVTHRQSPRVESREHPPANFLCPPCLLRSGLGSPADPLGGACRSGAQRRTRDVSAVRPRVGGPTKTCPSGGGRRRLSIRGDVPQRNGLSGMDGQVRNDAVGLGLWSADLRSARVGSPSAGSGARRRLPADRGPRLLGRPSRAAVDAPLLVLVGGWCGGRRVSGSCRLWAGARVAWARLAAPR